MREGTEHGSPNVVLKLTPSAWFAFLQAPFMADLVNIYISRIRVQMPSLNNFRVSLLVYVLLFLLLTFPFWGLGQTVSPHRKFLEFGIADVTRSGFIENRAFSDFTNGYIPEIHQHLKGARSGPLKLWTSENELGRPVYHTFGFSPAYPLSWVIAKITGNPLWFITILSLSYCFLAGLFVILLCRENRISPMAGLIAGSSMASCPFFMYWLTFPMFLAAFCWTAGALWASTRIATKGNLLDWTVLAFCIYSLFMTAHPDALVSHGGLLVGYWLYLSYVVQRQCSLFQLAAFFASCATAVFVAAVLTLPVYIDLTRFAAESGIFAVPLSAEELLPRLNVFTRALRFIILTGSPQLFGNPVEWDYPFHYDAVSVTPVIIFFAVIALFVSVKKTWGWWLAIVAICLASLFYPFYGASSPFAGFNSFHPSPLSPTILALMIIVAYGVDGLLKRSSTDEHRRVVWVAAGIALIPIPAALVMGLIEGIPLAWVAPVLIVIVLLLVYAARTEMALAFASLILAGGMISYPLMLRQYPEEVAATSPLVEKVRANLPAGSRFAVIAPGIPSLPPNLNATLEIPSVHSYNRLPSRHYQTLISSLGGRIQLPGYRNVAISPDYNGAMFWMSNIGMVLSPKKLSHENLEYVGEDAGVYIYKVISRMGEIIQIPGSLINLAANGLELGDPRLFQSHTPSKRVDEADMLEFEILPGVASVLVLSQQFNPAWEAQVFDGLEWQSAQTMPVNNTFQGVLLPRQVQLVRLEFKPSARFAWVAHGFWVLMLALLAFRTWRTRGIKLTKLSFKWS
jgi:hypothetical protein